MYVAVEHRITDPQPFWEVARAAAADPALLPVGVKLHAVLPSTDGARAVCIWEAAALEQIRAGVEAAVGQYSTNDYFEIDAANARGLPVATP